MVVSLVAAQPCIIYLARPSTLRLELFQSNSQNVKINRPGTFLSDRVLIPLLTIQSSNGLTVSHSASESARARKAAKSSNKNGNPIVLQSKILSAIQDPFSPSCVYLAESAGCVRRVDAEVGELPEEYIRSQKHFRYWRK